MTDDTQTQEEDLAEMVAGASPLRPLIGPIRIGKEDRYEITMWPYAFGQNRIQIWDIENTPEGVIDREL